MNKHLKIPYSFIAMLCITVLTTIGLAFSTVTAWADPSLTREEVVAFLNTDTAKRETAALANMGETDRINYDEIEFSTVAKVRYVRSGSVASEVPYFGNFEWHVAVKAGGSIRGSASVWSDNGIVAIGGFDPTVDEAEALPTDPDALLVVDLFNKEWYEVRDGTMSAVNDAARQRLPEPMALDAAAAKVSVGREATPEVTADDQVGGGNANVGPNLGHVVPWVVGLVAVAVVAAVGLAIGRRA